MSIAIQVFNSLFFFYWHDRQGASALGKSSPQGPEKWNLPETLITCYEKNFTAWKCWGDSYPKWWVAGVVSILNSATGTPLSATWGANIAAGYTTDDVPTTKHRSQLLSSSSR